MFIYTVRDPGAIVPWKCKVGVIAKPNPGSFDLNHAESSLRLKGVLLAEGLMDQAANFAHSCLCV